MIEEETLSASWEPPSRLGLKSREVSVSEIQSGSWFQRERPGSWFLGPSTITSVLSITKTKTQMFLWSFWIKYSASENMDEKSSSVAQIGTGKAELAAAGCSYIQHTTESQPWRFLLSICVCFKSRSVLTVGLNKCHHTHTAGRPLPEPQCHHITPDTAEKMCDWAKCAVTG